MAQRFRRWYCRQIARTLRRGRCDPRPGHALSGLSDRAGHDRASTAATCRRPAISASSPSRSPSPACRLSPRRSPIRALPLGVQIVAAPWREDLALRVAAAAEKLGVVAVPSAHRYLWRFEPDDRNQYPRSASPKSRKPSPATKARSSPTMSPSSTGCSGTSPYTLRYGVGGESLWRRGHRRSFARRGRPSTLTRAPDATP